MHGRNQPSRMLRRLNDESGSMVIALLAIIITSGLMITVTTYAFTGQRLARFDRNHVSVVQGADAGVHEALYRMGLPVGNPNRISTNVPMPATWTDMGETDYRYSVTQVGTKWRIESLGLMNGVTRRVRAEISRPTPFTMAAFADSRLTLVGSNSANSYDSTNWTTGEGNVGSNGTVTLNGNAAVDDVELHDFEANPNNRCFNPSGAYCTNAEMFDPKADISSEGALGFVYDAITASCPATPTVYKASVNGALAGGTYCFSRMDFDVDVNFTGTAANPTIVYLTGVDGQSTVAVANKKKVNCPSCTGTSGPKPDARRLQIFTASYGDVRFGNFTHFAGAVFAPRSSCKGNPSNAQGHVYGSLVCNVITNQGGWSFHYDEQLRDMGAGSFDIRRWAED